MVMLVDDCPRCGSQKIAFDVNGLNCTRVYNALGGGKTYEYEVYCVCRECHKTTMFLCRPLTKNKTLDGYNWESGIFGLKEVAEVVRPISPADLAVEEPPEFLPEHINSAYEEGAKCLAIGCYNAAATMFRLCLDYATKGLLPDPYCRSACDQPESSGDHGRSRTAGILHRLYSVLQSRSRFCRQRHQRPDQTAPVQQGGTGKIRKT